VTEIALWPYWHTAKSPQSTGWNTVKGNVFDFPNNCISSVLHGYCSVGTNYLILHPIKSLLFNELIQFGEDDLISWANSNVKTAQLDNGSYFLIGRHTTQNQPKIFWKICCFIELSTKQLSFLQLVMKLFQQIFWRHLRLVILLNSGISITLETAFFLHGYGFLPPSTKTFWSCFKETTFISIQPM